MEFHEKLQTLRRQKGLTQEELAAELFVSRTAISKWESGRGYPSIDSLKAISGFYGVTIDALLSGDEVLTIAREEQQERDAQHRDRSFGLLDCGSAMLLFLPLFGQEADGIIRAVALPGLTGVSAYLRIAYFALVLSAVGLGCFSLAVQGRGRPGISMGLSIAGVFLFLVSRQPYAAGFAFVFLLIKAMILRKTG